MACSPSTPPLSSFSHETAHSQITEGSPRLATPQTSSIGHGTLTTGLRSPSTTRPGTPLDLSSSNRRVFPLQGEGSKEYVGVGNVADTEVTGDGRSVDPTIKGVPQGWEDDLSIPVSRPASPAVPPPARPPLASTSSLRTRGQSRSRRPSTADAANPLVKNHTRLNSFRGIGKGETRAKLSTWSATLRDRAFPELAAAQAEAETQARTRQTEFDEGPVAKLSGTGLSETLPAGLPSVASASTRQSRPHQSGALGGSQLQSSSARTSSGDRRPAQSRSESRPTIGQRNSTFRELGAGSDDFADLFTPSHGENVRGPTKTTHSATACDSSSGYEESVTSTQSSTSAPIARNRNRVMGFEHPAHPNLTGAGSRLFLPPRTDEVLPFASASAFSAWDFPNPTQAVKPVSPIKGARMQAARRTSMSASRDSHELGSGSLGTHTGSLASLGAGEPAGEGWKDLARPRTGNGRKRVWLGPDGRELSGVYRVGWERDILNAEARLHEVMYDLAGGQHSFARVERNSQPKNVLDIGTGLGLWPVSQALQWRDTRFVGLDLVPCQIDLEALAKAERKARSSSSGSRNTEGIWESVAKRVTWERGNFLDSLPYDTGVFDMVHLRFISLGVPELAWPHLLDECARVLAPGGHLEIVEMSTPCPASAPANVQRSFASLLLAEMINPDPSLPIRFAIPTVSGLRMGKAVFSGAVPLGFGEPVWTWVKSALEYKGTGRVAGLRRGSRSGAGPEKIATEKIRQELRGLNREGRSWDWDDALGTAEVERGSRDASPLKSQPDNDQVRVWVWVGNKRS